MKQLTQLNLVGVVCLVGLCLIQWQQNRKLNLELNDCQAGLQQKEGQRLDLEKASREAREDLTQFRDQLARQQGERGEQAQKLQSQERRIADLSAERDALRGRLSEWMKAVTNRDDQLKRLTIQATTAAEDLKTAVTRYNLLATNHNSLVKELNELRAGKARLEPASTK